MGTMPPVVYVVKLKYISPLYYSAIEFSILYGQKVLINLQHNSDSRQGKAQIYINELVPIHCFLHKQIKKMCAMVDMIRFSVRTLLLSSVST